MSDTNDKTEIFDDAGEAIKGVVGGSSNTAKSALLLVGGLILTLSVFGWANSDTLKTFVQVSHDIKHLQQAHDQCHEAMSKLTTEVASLRNEVATLKRNL